MRVGFEPTIISLATNSLRPLEQRTIKKEQTGFDTCTIVLLFEWSLPLVDSASTSATVLYLSNQKLISKPKNDNL